MKLQWDIDDADEACEPIFSECTSQDEVKNYNENIVVKKYVENREIRRKNMEISSPQYESETANKANNELKLLVDEQQDDIKHLKEYCDIDDIEPPWK